MRVAAAGLACLTAALAAGAARAGPWAQPQGQGQVIFKYEDMVARRGFDADGRLADLPAERREGSLGVFAEYGLSDRLTLQIKGDWQQGEDAFVDYDGRGPLEIGVTWQVWRDAKSAISLYGGYADAGKAATPAMLRRVSVIMTGRRGCRSDDPWPTGAALSTCRPPAGFATACRTRRVPMRPSVFI